MDKQTVQENTEDQNRIGVADQEAEKQAGFWAGRSTKDHLFSSTQILEKMAAVNKEVHLLFVDLKKAYDSFPLIKL